MAVVIDGTFNNVGLVIVDGFFLRVDKGSFVNSTGAVVINNTNIFTGDEGTFTNNGTLPARQSAKNPKALAFLRHLYEYPKDAPAYCIGTRWARP
jgi:hypothetical protein